VLAVCLGFAFLPDRFPFLARNQVCILAFLEQHFPGESVGISSQQDVGRDSGSATSLTD
jgi:hypothetical protein